MIDSAKYENALRALHLLLCQTRTMALRGDDHGKIAEVLDWAELLPLHIAHDDDKTADFVNVLEAIAEKNRECRIALKAFSSPIPTRHSRRTTVNAGAELAGQG